jgi:hypothetical protein
MAGTGTPAIKKIGLSFFFQPDPVTISGTTTTFPFVDAGTLTQRTIKTDVGEEVIYDDRDGNLTPVHVSQNKYDPTYDLEAQNISAANLAMYFRSLPPIAWTQSAGTSTDIAHKAWPNAPIKIVDGSNNPQYMVASITNLKVSSTPGVRGVDFDYIPGDLDRGFIYILPSSTLVTAANTAVTITYVLAAVTAGYEIDPLSGACTIEGYGEIHGGACEGRSRMVHSGRFAITFPELTMAVDKIATSKISVRKLKDSGSNLPNGRVLLPKGQW